MCFCATSHHPCITANTIFKVLTPPCSEWAADISSQTANDFRMSMAVSASQNYSIPAMQPPPLTFLAALRPLLLQTTSFKPLSASHYHAFTTNVVCTICSDCNDARLEYIKSSRKRLCFLQSSFLNSLLKSWCTLIPLHSLTLDYKDKGKMYFSPYNIYWTLS